MYAGEDVIPTFALGLDTGSGLVVETGSEIFTVENSDSFANDRFDVYRAFFKQLTNGDKIGIMFRQPETGGGTNMLAQGAGITIQEW